MTIETPAPYFQANTYSARIDRFPIDVMYEEGVITPTSCKVTQRGAGANYTVDIAVGSFVIQGDDQANQGKYLGRVTGVENATITAAPGSNSRLDLVTLRVNDPNAGGNAGSNITAVVIAGTPSASPVVPALPASSIALAVIGPISTSTASITNSIITDSRLIAGRKAPAGTLEEQAGATIPNGWLYCNGQNVSRTTFADLFAEIGTLYGVGDGSTTFTLPDFRDRVSVSKGTVFTIAGVTGGEVTHTLTNSEMPVHNHTGITSNNNVDHSHPVNINSGTESVQHQHTVGGGTRQFEAGNGFTTGTAAGIQTSIQFEGLWSTTDSENATHYHNVNGNTSGASTTHYHTITNDGGGGAHNNMQPYQVIGGKRIKY